MLSFLRHISLRKHTGEAMEISPIAYIKTDFPEKFGVPRQSGRVDSLIGEIVFSPEYSMPEAFRGIEEFSHLWLLWEFSEAVRKDWSPTVRPPRLGGNKRMGVSKKFITLRQESYENITSELGIQYRMNRSIQVEGAFGVLKNDYEFQRFLLRGKTKVKLEILLLCFGYNINKLHTKIQNDRTQTHFFEVKTA